MGYFEKFYNKGKEKIEELRKKFQGPFHEFEAKVKDLEKDHNEAKKMLAKTNALKISSEKDIERHNAKIKELDNKIKETVKKAENGEMPSEISDKIALQSLTLKKAYEERVKVLNEMIPKYDEESIKLKEFILKLDSKLTYYKEELEFLKTNTKFKEDTKTSTEDLFYDEQSVINRIEEMRKKMEGEIDDEELQKELDKQNLEEELHKANLMDELNKIKKDMKK